MSFATENNDYSLFTFLGLPPVIDRDDRPFEFLEEIPEFDLETTSFKSFHSEALTAALTDFGAEKEERLATKMETASVSECPETLMLTSSKSRDSALSFQPETLARGELASEESSSNSQEETPLPTTTNGTSFDQILLEMVDEESLNFLLKKQIKLDPKLQEFLACTVEVMTKQHFPTLQGETPEAWVTRANKLLVSSTQKRKDQKLRMIFNKIVKMLINSNCQKESSRESKSSKLESFLEKFAPKRQAEFEALIKGCKFPSKRKLKAIFGQFLLFRNEIRNLIENGIFMREYIKKRQLKASRLVTNFMLAQATPGSTRASTVASLRDCIKSFPWSLTDLHTSCGLLQSTLGEGL